MIKTIDRQHIPTTYSVLLIGTEKGKKKTKDCLIQKKFNFIVMAITGRKRSCQKFGKAYLGLFMVQIGSDSYEFNLNPRVTNFRKYDSCLDKKSQCRVPIQFVQIIAFVWI